MTREDDERSLRRELRRIQRKKQERVRQLLLMTMFGCVFLIVAAAAIVLIRTVFGEKPADPKEVAVPD